MLSPSCRCSRKSRLELEGESSLEDDNPDVHSFGQELHNGDYGRPGEGGRRPPDVRDLPARQPLRAEYPPGPGQRLGAEISRSPRGRAASSSHSRASVSCWTVGRPPAARSRSVSSTAHASTYNSSWSRSSSSRAITSSFSLSSSSAARCRETQSHWRQRCEQNSRGRPGPVRSGSSRRHQRQHGAPSSLAGGGEFVMTKG